ncbi:MAG: MGMT family protein [Anaerolineae bacterium]
MTSKLFERVWCLVARIPKGRVATYGQIARMLGMPRGARTVGWAMHSLPEGSGVPWYRVLSAPGRIPRIRAGETMGLQKALLEEEGVTVGPEGTVDLNCFGWEGLSPLEVEALLVQVDKDEEP